MIRELLSKRLLRHWFSGASGRLNLAWRFALLVLEGIYLTLLGLREAWFSIIRRPKQATGIRVIAIGNLVVGGAGKTPAVMAIAQAFQQQGVVCGILTRGYGSRIEAGRTSRAILPDELGQFTADDVGDEAWLLGWRTQCPIGVGANRYKSLLALRARVPNLQVVILDDGLQQRSLRCDERYLVIDARGFGNGHCLPYGPLRQPAMGLTQFTGWIDHGLSDVQVAKPLVPAALPGLKGLLRQTETGWIGLDISQGLQIMSIEEGIQRFQAKRVLAVAGIATPEKFFAILDSMGVSHDRLPLADHEPEIAKKILSQWQTSSYDVVLMTEKDAVKMFGQNMPFQNDGWALRRTATLDQEFLNQLMRAQ